MSQRWGARGGRRGLARRASFYVLLSLFLLLYVPLTPLPYAVLGWFLDDIGGISHKVHETSFGVVFALSAAGLIAQYREPQRRLGQMYQAALPVWAVVAALVVISGFVDAITMTFLIVPCALVALHPGRAALLRPRPSWSRPLVILTIAAAVPLGYFAVDQFRFEATAAAIAGEVVAGLPDDASPDDFTSAIRRAAGSPERRQAALHYQHWSAIGAFGLSVAALAAVAAARPPGWRLPAWSAAVAVANHALVSLAFPEDASAFPAAWAAAAIAWAAAFVIIAERVARSGVPELAAAAGGDQA